MTCKLEAIFKRQAEFVKSLRPIYEHNEFFPHARPMPWDLNSRVYQEEFRLLAWRCTEEVYEAIYALRVNNLVVENHFREEVADAFHFFVELCLATGIGSRDVISHYEGLRFPQDEDALDHVFKFVGSSPNDSIIDRWNLFVERLARAMMMLRQRPWRTDDRPTQERVFHSQMAASFMSFIAACKRSGITADSLHEAYFAKGKINDQRTADQKL